MAKPISGLMLLGALLLAAVVASPAAACSPRMSILKSPRVGSREVQAKALNDRGDVVGFADGRDGRYRSILWRGGLAARSFDALRRVFPVVWRRQFKR